MLLNFAERHRPRNVSAGRSRHSAEIFIRAVSKRQPERQVRFQRNGPGINLCSQ
jgi:hypothetical protein